MRGKTLEQLVNEAQANVEHITADALHTAVEKSEPLIILDIRDKELYDAGHLPGAVSLPRAAIELDIDEIVPDQDTRIVTYCGGSTRGSLSAHTLKIMGYEHVSMLDGGFRGWKADGLPVEGAEGE
ncbi:MAG: rhodanese-like domain-containing protein [Candidatus Poribacteria bacterium]|nr:rhodanese-like domain-containing protein [Candidatus Poribacteria bacterium]MDE0503264.1 rhodanese-like domain-containing protein [Candidatus Poribacteria bacterium]